MATELFKNAIIYTLMDGVNVSPDELESHLAKKGKRVVGKLERQAVNSWTMPAGHMSQVYLHDIQGQRYMMMKTQKRAVPGSAIKELVNQAVAEEEEQTGEKVNRKAKREIKERVTDSLLPDAPISTGYTPVWWDTQNNRIVVGCSGRKQADAALTLLRETLGSLPSLPLSTEVAPVKRMTDWVADAGERPGWMTLGDKATFSSCDQDGKFSGSKVDLDGNEVEQMLSAGCRVKKLAIKMVGQASFELTEECELKGISIDDAVRDESSGEDAGDDPISRLESEFVIASDTLTWVIDQVTQELGGERKVNEDDDS